MGSLLSVKHLNVRFNTPEGEVHACRDISFNVRRGEILGVVGESGSGKTQIFMALMGLLARNGHATGSAELMGNELLNRPARFLNQYRGKKIGMIFQDPMTSLNPYLRLSTQMLEVLQEHQGMSRVQARRKIIEALHAVKIPEPERRMEAYPHEFSGGMRQRIMIAMNLLCCPHLVIADEPTTALDVTVQAQILDLLRDLAEKQNCAVILITHDLGVVARLCHKVMVIYAGRIVEKANVQEIFYNPQHPYTRALIDSTPRLDESVHDMLRIIDGQPPNILHLPKGCAFQERCPYVHERCYIERPKLKQINEQKRWKACHLSQI